MSQQDSMFDEALLIFFDEAREMLQQMEDSLLCLEQKPQDQEAVHALFRAAHTIKGTSGIFNLTRVVNFTHQLESVLDRLRKGGLAIDTSLSEVLFASCDMMAKLLEQTEQHCEAEDELAECDRVAEALKEKLSGFMGNVPARAVPSVDVSAGADLKNSGAESVWHLSLRFHGDTFRNGFDPLTVIEYLKTIGEIKTIATVDEVVPEWSVFDPETCSLGFEIRLKTDAGKSDIEAAFEFVGDDCEVHIIAPTRRAADFIQLIHDLPHEQRLGDILVACGAVTREDINEALAQQEESEDGTPRLASQAVGQILVANDKVASEVVDAAVERQSNNAASRHEGGSFVRVPSDKLDELINLVGELVICGASASLQAVKSRDPGLIGTTEQLSHLVEEIRNGALGLRMVRIGETFVRYRRVVHDISSELGKKVSLEIQGADTELDKSVVEKIGDPLMHLVRNALDHGIEMPAVRQALGKPADGTIRLSARHDSGNIVIEVSDDGRGLDGDMLLSKARERGLVSETQTFSETEKFDLIFTPGFSTAEKVTNLSGRGVGMDVVRKNIEALRGSIKIHSVLGHGTTMEIRLPLTLAIIDGFLVKIGDGTFVIPLHAVLECIDADPDRMNLNDKSAGFIKLRGEVLPLLDLRSVFACDGPPPDKRRIVVIQSGGDDKAGMVVDFLEGEYQTVIKPLGKLFRYLRGISGSTVLGSGEVALILDVGALVKLAVNQKTDEAIDRQKALQRDLQAIGMGQGNVNREI
ncbi:chemotaxis protein CheA [Herbaspirillum sp. RTI4]|uniref:chemotaxis protein CheA n=1 Tax=Herbaspirillum sp. RTI4 TaxID=3048640 RepID=UPI002AB5D2B5|nr:chemotaxis protein CheA [Herbaspirillum sp. RTI4]MDY7578086.1 chemotaxis protein CheA [Herbaspirillum sp. RTI4]MEA9980676.1 chemotaxis protein CheA [Herbaspirillum sp. RTI4]